MTIPLAKSLNGKKYMWDNAVYESEEHARQAADAYEKDGFEAMVIGDAENHLVYSRRIAVVQSAE